MSIARRGKEGALAASRDSMRGNVLGGKGQPGGLSVTPSTAVFGGLGGLC